MRPTTLLLLALSCGLLAASPARAADFTCPLDHGLHAHPHDGSKYIECIKSAPTVKSCPPGQLWDDLRKGCTAPGNVRKAPPRKPKAKPKTKPKPRG